MNFSIFSKAKIKDLLCTICYFFYRLGRVHNLGKDFQTVDVFEKSCNLKSVHRALFQVKRFLPDICLLSAVGLLAVFHLQR